MHTIRLANGYLRSTDRANRDGTPFLAVDSNGGRKRAAKVPRPGIENIPMFWVAREVDDVDDAFRDRPLRLNAGRRQR